MLNVHVKDSLSMREGNHVLLLLDDAIEFVDIVEKLLVLPDFQKI